MNPTLLSDLADRAARLADRASALRDLLRGAGARLDLTDDQADAELLVLPAALGEVEAVEARLRAALGPDAGGQG